MKSKQLLNDKSVFKLAALMCVSKTIIYYI